MKYDKNILRQYEVSAIVTILLITIVLGMIIMDFDSFVAFVYLPACIGIWSYALNCLVGIYYTKRKRNDACYLTSNKDTIIYFNFFEKVIYSINKCDITQIKRKENCLHIYVKTKRKLTLLDKIVSVLTEDRHFMYPILLYSNPSNLEEFLGFPIESESKEIEKRELLGLSRCLFVFLFLIATYLLSCEVIRPIWLRGLCFIISLGILLWDIKKNKVCFYEEKHLFQISIKCVSIGFFLSQYLSLGTYWSNVILMDGTSELIFQKIIVRYVVFVIISYVLFMFNNNLVVKINGVRG